MVLWRYNYRVLREEVALKLRDITKGNIRPNHVLVRGPSHLLPAKMLQYLKGKSSYRLQIEFPKLQKKYWGRHLWFRGYFRATVGPGSEEQIKHYTENQLDGANVFEVWDEQEETDKG